MIQDEILKFVVLVFTDTNFSQVFVCYLYGQVNRSVDRLFPSGVLPFLL